jgi:imidazolonepropionase-like amidohydrolase
MKKALLLLFLSVFLTKTYAQDYFPVNESVHNKNKNYTVFTNATIYVTPTQKIEKGTLLIQDGKVVAVGNAVSIPKNAITIDLAGKTIYPSFIDIYTSFGIEKPKGNITPGRNRNPLYDTKRVGYYWNESVRPEINVYETFKYDQPKADELLKAGFGVVGTHVPDGIAQGTGALVALNNEDNSKQIITNKLTNHLSFSKSALTNQAYPSSLMGSMALLRQMYLDLDWYKKGNSETKDLSLEALANNEKLVQIFASEDKLNSLRAAKIAKEFGLNYVLKGSGNEFERIEEIKATNAKFIIPISFPEAYDVSNPYLSNQIELADMRFWNQAPTNLKVLSDNGIVFALTTDKLKKIEDFKPNLLKAIKLGFDKTKALEALTTVPAAMLGKSDEVGSLKVGTYANFIITSGEVFDEKTVLYENWVQGSKFIVNDLSAKDIRGNYDLTVGKDTYKWKIDGTADAQKSEVTTVDAKKVKSTFSIAKNWISLVIKPADTIKSNYTRLSGFIEKTDALSGKAVLSNGDELVWTAVKTSPFVMAKDSSKVEKPNPIIPVTYPNVAFGDTKKQTAQTLLF